MNAILIDTNVLLYAHDKNDLARQNRALEVLRRLEETGSGRLSVQCLAEFFSVSTRKLIPPLNPFEAAEQVELLARVYPVFDLTQAIVLEAIRGVCDHQLSYWDAQLWAIAKLNQVPVVFSEDFSAGQSLEGVRFIDPLASAFTIGDWVW